MPYLGLVLRKGGESALFQMRRIKSFHSAVV